MKAKTAELKGAALDWAVAVAIGKSPKTSLGFGDGPEGGRSFYSVFVEGTRRPFEPCKSWAQAGDLITRFRISMTEQGVIWVAECRGGEPIHGYDPLTAICRAVVLAQIGDQVEIPDELMEGRGDEG